MCFRLGRGRCIRPCIGWNTRAGSGGVGPSQSNRRAKYYSLTTKGKRRLEAERDSWDRMTTAISLVLNQAGSEAP